MSSKRVAYFPDFIFPPGTTLREVLSDRGMTGADLAAATGRTEQTISEIMQGIAQLTPATALQLEHVLGVPASFWNNLERRYREHLAREQCEETSG